MFAIGLALLTGYHFFVAPYTGAQAVASEAGPAKSIIVVDTKTVLQAHIEQMEGKIAGGATYTQEEIQNSGAEFAAEYLRTIKKYREAGYLVIDKKYALGVPVGSEITEEVGRSLQLDVKARPDPFLAPELD
jgi:hypothetical protein